MFSSVGMGLEGLKDKMSWFQKKSKDIITRTK